MNGIFAHEEYNKVEVYREEDYSARLVQLIDLVGEDESHPLASMMEVVGSVLVAKYEEEYVPDY